jgi:hypothetical protein
LWINVIGLVDDRLLPEFAHPFFEPFPPRLDPVGVIGLGDPHGLVTEEH